MSNAHVWRAALERLRPQMTRAQFDTWLRGTSLAAAPDGAIVLRVRTTFAKELLETRFRERIETAIAAVSGKACRLTVAVAPGSAQADEAPAEPRVPARAAAAHTQAVRALPARRPSRSLQFAGASPTLFDASPTDPAASPTSSPGTPAASVGAPHAAPGVPRRPPTHADGTVTSVGARHASPGEHAARPRPTGTAPTNRVSVPRAGALARKRPALAAKADARGARVRAALDRSRSGAHELRAPSDFMPDAASDEEGGTSAHSPTVLSAAESAPLPILHAGMSGPLRFDGQVRSAAEPADDLAGQLYAGSQLVRPRLNPRYTFASFIVGSGNQLAHAASQAVAEAPGQAYNPLFLYGGVGLGKTHLLHAIGHATMARDLIVLYVSSETFTNEIINAIRYRTTEEFRAKYRSVDVLLVDDIQFIAGKESTEEEFFHTFNSLYETSKQIVICSDRPPKAIVSLEERLRSRFEWGLIADIQPPDLETRVAILRAKADMMGRRVPDDVVTFLAGRVQSNIRELEGSLNRLLAFTQLQGQPLTIETAKAALASLATDGRQRRVTIDEILAAVADFYRISADDLKGKQRDKHIVVPRQVAMYLMRQETEASLLEVGQALGGRDHSTVLHGCEKIAREINDNTTLRKEVLAIRQQLLG